MVAVPTPGDTVFGSYSRWPEIRMRVPAVYGWPVGQPRWGRRLDEQSGSGLASATNDT